MVSIEPQHYLYPTRFRKNRKSLFLLIRAIAYLLLPIEIWQLLPENMLEHVNITQNIIRLSSEYPVGKYVLMYFFDNNCVISIRS